MTTDESGEGSCGEGTGDEEPVKPSAAELHGSDDHAALKNENAELRKVLADTAETLGKAQRERDGLSAEVNRLKDVIAQQTHRMGMSHTQREIELAARLASMIPETRNVLHHQYLRIAETLAAHGYTWSGGELGPVPKG